MWPSVPPMPPAQTCFRCSQLGQPTPSAPQKGLVQEELDGRCGPQWGLGFRGALPLGCPQTPFPTYFPRMQSSRNSYEPLGDKTTRSLVRPHEVTLGGSW